MEHYSTNAKNRKLKKQVLGFLSRIGFASGGLPLSGKMILIFALLLLSSLFFPWLQIASANNDVKNYSAFSQEMGYIGYGIVVAVVVIMFFLLSHTKKEHIRAYVPFRLSDTQAIVFVSSLVLVATIELFVILPVYGLLGGVSVERWGILALTSVVMMILCGFFFSRSMKMENTESYYLNRDISDNLGEYKNIIHPNVHQQKERKKQNMSLPI